MSFESLPQEIVDYIVDNFIEEADAREKTRVLIPLSRVSRRWRIAASRRLYSSVKIDRFDKASLLHRTLLQSRFLASFIDKLVFTTSGKRNDREFTKLLQLCISTRHFKLHGYTPHEPDRFTEALAKLPLISINVKVACTEPNGFLFRNSTTFVRFLRNLPKIEKIISHGGLFPALSSARLEPFVPNRILDNHTCQHLKELSLAEEEVFSEEGLKALRLLSLPRLRCLTIAYGGVRKVDDILIECLDSWTNLEELTLMRKVKGEPKLSDYFNAFGRQTKLRSLSLSKSIISVTDIPGLPSNISTLILSFVLVKSDLDHLAAIIAMVDGSQERLSRILPCLNVLKFYSQVQYHEFKRHPLVDTCKARGISLCALFYTHAGPGRRYWRWSKKTFRPSDEKTPK